MTKQISSSQSTEQWWITGLRATAFIDFHDNEQIMGNTWWEDIIGSKPNEEHIRHLQRQKEQKGMFEGNDLTILSDPNRADWILTTKISDSLGLPKLPTLASGSDVLKSFLGIIGKWLNECPPTSRLAFGANLVVPCTDLPVAHKAILQFLPYMQLSAENVADFFYQINRYTKSTCNKNTTINRLSRWSVVTQFPTESQMESNELIKYLYEQRPYACALELDISTKQSRKPLSRDITWPIFQELVKHGIEIAIKGDIP